MGSFKADMSTENILTQTVTCRPDDLRVSPGLFRSPPNTYPVPKRLDLPRHFRSRYTSESRYPDDSLSPSAFSVMHGPHVISSHVTCTKDKPLIPVLFPVG